MTCLAVRGGQEVQVGQGAPTQLAPEAGWLGHARLVVCQAWLGLLGAHSPDDRLAVCDAARRFRAQQLEYEPRYMARLGDVTQADWAGQELRSLSVLMNAAASLAIALDDADDSLASLAQLDADLDRANPRLVSDPETLSWDVVELLRIAGHRLLKLASG